MLRLLLDEHISPLVADGLRRRHRALKVVCIAEWAQGKFLAQPDAICLQQASEQRLTLVTYDRRTIPPLLKSWAEEGREHGGVIFVDEKSIAPAEIGKLVRALSSLWRKTANWDWRDRVGFLHH
jgi:hypothetical protein